MNKNVHLKSQNPRFAYTRVGPNNSNCEFKSSQTNINLDTFIYNYYKN